LDKCVVCSKLRLKWVRDSGRITRSVGELLVCCIARLSLPQLVIAFIIVAIVLISGDSIIVGTELGGVTDGGGQVSDLLARGQEPKERQRDETADEVNSNQDPVLAQIVLGHTHERIVDHRAEPA